eukprot:3740768-Pyramimonas_sp.AAC.1
MHKKKGSTAKYHKRYPGYGIDELNNPKRRDELAKASHVGLIPLFMPCLDKAEYLGGATLEHLANDTPIGPDLILLPEAGGDARCDMATLRDQSAKAQENRIAAILQLQTEGTVDQRNMITMIRKARAL